MWQIDNRTPFAAERGWTRDRNGAEVWLVAVKCTFDIQPEGSTVVSAEQPPILRVPEYHGEPGKSSLKYEADLVMTKTATDIIVAGHAYTPHGQPIRQMDAGFRVGPVQKVVRVFGDRRWESHRISQPEPFTKMPIVYERAFGGVDRKSPHAERDWDWRNPVGTGFAIARANVDGLPLPNIEYPDELIGSWKDRPRPAALGAIGGHWQPRVSFAGTYDDTWMRERQPLLPTDFDDRFFQCVPPDQQAAGFLRGGEPVVLHRLTPHGDLRFVLPKIFLGFETRFYDGSRELHRHRKLHTVILEPDYPRVSLVWHTALACHFKVHKLERTVVTLKTTLNAGSSEDEPGELELG
jgi:hypothetical protein